MKYNLGRSFFLQIAETAKWENKREKYLNNANNNNSGKNLWAEHISHFYILGACTIFNIIEMKT